MELGAQVPFSYFTTFRPCHRPGWCIDPANHSHRATSFSSHRGHQRAGGSALQPFLRNLSTPGTHLVSTENTRTTHSHDAQLMFNLGQGKAEHSGKRLVGCQSLGDGDEDKLLKISPFRLFHPSRGGTPDTDFRTRTIGSGKSGTGSLAPYSAHLAHTPFATYHDVTIQQQRERTELILESTSRRRKASQVTHQSASARPDDSEGVASSSASHAGLGASWLDLPTSAARF